MERSKQFIGKCVVCKPKYGFGRITKTTRSSRLRMSVVLTPVGLEAKHPVSFRNANFPTDLEGRTYHLGTKKGEVANHILCVGSEQRAELIGSFLTPTSPNAPLFRLYSRRGFLTITGLYNGTLVSIVSTNMGMPNMDFVVRENRAVVEGNMAFIRLGTCGAVQRPAKMGDILIASVGSISLRRDPDSWTLGSESEHYVQTRPVPADPEISRLLEAEARHEFGLANVVMGLNVSCDSFYSSQGRVGGDFDDRNEHLVDNLIRQHPNLISMEMETFHLYDLARSSRGTVRSAAMHIALAERYSNRFIDYSKLPELELRAGRVALAALVALNL